MISDCPSLWFLLFHLDTATSANIEIGHIWWHIVRMSIFLMLYCYWIYVDIRWQHVFPFSRGATRNARNCDWIAALLTANMILMMTMMTMGWWCWWCWRQQEKHGEKMHCATMCHHDMVMPMLMLAAASDDEDNEGSTWMKETQRADRLREGR